MSRTQQPDRTVRECVDGDDVRVRLWRSDPEFAARIEIVATKKWAFGIDDESIATLLTSTATGGLVCDPDVPGWVGEILVGFGVADIDTRRAQ